MSLLVSNLIYVAKNISSAPLAIHGFVLLMVFAGGNVLYYLLMRLPSEAYKAQTYLGEALKHPIIVLSLLVPAIVAVSTRLHWFKAEV